MKWNINEVGRPRENYCHDVWHSGATRIFYNGVYKFDAGIQRLARISCKLSIERSDAEMYKRYLEKVGAQAE